MAVGDVFSNITEIGPSESLNIKPPSNQEAVIHNIHHSGPAALYFIKENPYLEVLVDDDSGPGSWSAFFFHCTPTLYYKIKNTGNTTIVASFDGVITKSS